jgi:hypothetical protein
MYIFIISMGVIGLFCILMTCRFGDIVAGVGILVILSLVWKIFGIMVRVPLLAGFSPEYLFGFGIVVFELLYMIL